MLQTTQRLDGISILRTVATIGIMLYHIGFGHHYFRFLNFAGGIHIFFCISAFLIMYSTRSRSPADFLKRRLVRILPLYLILTVLTFIAGKFIGDFGQDAGIPELIKSLFLIPYQRGAIRGDNVIRPIVGSGWTLYYEVWFAFVFCISMKIKHKFRGIIAAAACLAAYVAGLLLPAELTVTRLLRTGFLFDFVAGIAAFYLWELFLKKIDFRFRFIWAFPAAASVILFYLGPRYPWLLATEALAILILILLATYQKPVPKLFTWFSNLSYSFYLIHYYVIIVVAYFFDLTKLSVKTAIASLLVFILTLAASYVSYILIEKKLCGALNKLIKFK